MLYGTKPYVLKTLNQDVATLSKTDSPESVSVKVKKIKNCSHTFTDDVNGPFETHDTLCIEHDNNFYEFSNRILTDKREDCAAVISGLNQNVPLTKNDFKR